MYKAVMRLFGVYDVVDENGVIIEGGFKSMRYAQGYADELNQEDDTENNEDDIFGK